MAKEIVNSQLDRMKALMNYGLQTESKQAYSTVEYQKVGADGKTYGILREGTKFYIKVAPKKDNLVKEDFSYIGGFRNRKDNEYTSYANAQKQFDLKMRSLNESYSNGKNIVIESWNPDKQQELSVEATDNMRKEILRERQIMANAMIIETKGSKKSQNLKNEFKPKVEADTKETTQELPKGVKAENCGKECCGNCAGKNDGPNGPFNIKVEGKTKDGNVIEETAEVLGFARNHDDYMDKSHGTKIGKSAPFDNGIEKEQDAVADADGGEEIPSQTGKVNEGKAMHNADNQNTPEPGTGEIGDTAPFNGEKGKQIDEADEMIGDDPEQIIDDAEDLELDDEPEVDDTEMPEGDDDVDLGDDEEGLDEPIDDGSEDFDDAELDDEMGDAEEDAEDVDDDVYKDDIEDRLNNVEELLMQIADKLGISQDVDESEYEDNDDLFDDDNTETEGGEEPEYDLDMDDDSEMPEEGEEDYKEDRLPESRSYRGARIFETHNYRRVMNEENRLNDFGKHPAYQKKVMTYPTPDMQEFEGYYDMNDDSVKGEQPYGQKIGSTAPFTISPEQIDNSIAESLNRILRRQRKN